MGQKQFFQGVWGKTVSADRFTGPGINSALESRGANGVEYYVSGNYGSDGNDGLTWDRPFKTVAHACAVSHANIAASSKGWAARNTIYISGDAFEESLTKLAQKTDIVGVGSCNGVPTARITGTHVIDSLQSYMGCRLINIDIMNSTNGVTVTLPTLQGGIGFYDCAFSCNGTGTIGLLATATVDLTVKGCNFRNWGGAAFSTAAIDLGAGTAHRTRIEDNIIEGAKGIRVNGARAGLSSYILRNTFNVTTLTVDDASATFLIFNNRGKTAAAKEIATVLNCNVLTAGDNVFGNATGIGIYPAYAAIT